MLKRIFKVFIIAPIWAVGFILWLYVCIFTSAGRVLWRYIKKGGELGAPWDGELDEMIEKYPNL